MSRTVGLVLKDQKKEPVKEVESKGVDQKKEPVKETPKDKA